jgi:hypothetical protein
MDNIKFEITPGFDSWVGENRDGCQRCSLVCSIVDHAVTRAFSEEPKNYGEPIDLRVSVRHRSTDRPIPKEIIVGGSNIRPDGERRSGYFGFYELSQRLIRNCQNCGGNKPMTRSKVIFEREEPNSTSAVIRRGFRVRLG